MNTFDSSSPSSLSGEGGSASRSFRLVILGGGEAGLAVLEALAETDLISSVALVEPSAYHYDQPAWMRVGTEGMQKEHTRSPEEIQIPPAVTWIRDRVNRVDPERRVIVTNSNTEIQYDYLVVALGTDVRWDRIRGLKESLGTHGICSVYGYEAAEQAWDMIRAFEGGAGPLYRSVHAPQGRTRTTGHSAPCRCPLAGNRRAGSDGAVLHDGSLVRRIRNRPRPRGCGDSRVHRV